MPGERAADIARLAEIAEEVFGPDRVDVRESLADAVDRAAEVAEAGAEPAAIVAQCRAVIEANGGIDLDYIALVDAGTFEILAGTESVPVGEGAAAPTILSDGSREGRILIAAKVGTTRLIDNMEVPLRDASGPDARLAERAGDLA